MSFGLLDKGEVSWQKIDLNQLINPEENLGLMSIRIRIQLFFH